MKSKYKAYWRLNLMSLFFIIISFISVTLAWFAYSGLSKVSTAIDVKAWYITLEKDGNPISNDITISLSEIYPGMETVNEIVKIKNLGDSDASLKYSIVSARILDDDEFFIDDDETTTEFVEDLLSHDYPFHININLSKKYILAKEDESIFEVSISWPLDSDTDKLDSEWGSEAYNFQQSEANKRKLDDEYQVRPSIQVILNVTAEQYLEEDEASDVRFNLGDLILYDVVADEVCNTIGNDCLSTYVIDVNNKLKDSTVTLLPSQISDFLSTFDNYGSTFDTLVHNWQVDTRELKVTDILSIISTDVMNSWLVRDELSNALIGNLEYGDRIDTEISKAIHYDGYYIFNNSKFKFLSLNSCYWTNSSYNYEKGFRIVRLDEEYTKLEGFNKDTSCYIVPVIIADKDKFK